MSPELVRVQVETRARGIAHSNSLSKLINQQQDSLGCPVVQGNEQPNNPSLISLRGVGKSYSGAWVLKDASFSVSRGELVALVGENGAGKSTLKNILCGLVAPDVGSLIVEGKDYSRLTTHDARSIGIAAVHQELSLFPN